MNPVAPPVVTADELREAFNVLSDIVLTAVGLHIVAGNYEAANASMAEALRATFLDGVVYGAAHGDGLREI